MNELATILVSAVIGGIVSGGAIAGVFMAALETRLRKTFATVESQKGMAPMSELNALGSRVNGLETVAIQARDRADEAADRAAILEERQHQHWKTVTEQIIRPVERMAEKLEAMLAEQARQGESLRNVYQRLNGKS